MYKWLTAAAAIGSTGWYMSSKQIGELNLDLLSTTNMTNASSTTILNGLTSYDFDWIPNGDYDTTIDDVIFSSGTQKSNSTSEFTHSYLQQTPSSYQTRNLHHNTDSSSTLVYCSDTSYRTNSVQNQYYSFSNAMLLSTSKNGDNCNMDLGFHSESSKFGFSSLQNRIESVKSDLITLSNKLNTNYPIDDNLSSCTSFKSPNGFHNLSFGDKNDLDESEAPKAERGALSEDKQLSNEDTEDKSWKCPSQYGFQVDKKSNRYSELSENTQKILNRLQIRNTEKEEEENTTDIFNSFGEHEPELEEDNIDLGSGAGYSSGGCNSLIQSFMSRGSNLPAIEELVDEEAAAEQSDEEYEDDEDEASSEDIFESVPMTTPCSTVSRSSYRTAQSSLGRDTLTPTGFHDDLDSPSDLEAIHSSTSTAPHTSQSMGAREPELQLPDHSELLSTTLTAGAACDCSEPSSTMNELTLRPDYDDDDAAIRRLETDSDTEMVGSICGSQGEDDDNDYEAEAGMPLDPVSCRVPSSKLLQSSLPDLLEEPQLNEDPNHRNRSTDLDKLLLTSPENVGKYQQQRQRLSVSTGNLAVRCVVMETDLDSGYVSVYHSNSSNGGGGHPQHQQQPQPISQPSRQWLSQRELLNSLPLPTNTTPDFGFHGNRAVSTNQVSANLAARLRDRAQSIPELRVADSLARLDLPGWMLHSTTSSTTADMVSMETGNNTVIKGGLNSHNSLPLNRTALPASSCAASRSCSSNTLSYPGRACKSIPRKSATASLNSPSRPVHSAAVVLPSQLLRQTCPTKRQLQPIRICQARIALLPSKVTMTLGPRTQL